ncbi:hypothetical protein [Microtetraspora niveoalba]|uniref:hypothetical protein n=1 Tax=Microtetraspora niveoalba TaxID=46175 RepID=UPI000A5C87B7|nr:hypothetical protein [Microtetraspora niveoalba]
MSLPPPDHVLVLLKAGRPIPAVERATGWPAAAIRRLVARQRGWLIGPNGHVYDPTEIRGGKAPSMGADAARELHARLQERRKLLGLTWPRVALQMHLPLSRLDGLREGSGSVPTQRRAEEWLTKTSRFLLEEKEIPA